MQIFLQILTLLGSVALFLFGLSLLSGGLQKVAGDGLRSFLASMTSNPFKQILTGIGVTAAIQSSTATTIMVVSFVNAGLLVLGQAIGRMLGRAHKRGKWFDEDMVSKLSRMVELVDAAFKATVENLKIPQMFIRDISNSEKAEDDINALRDELREEHIDNCENPEYNYQTGVFYIDIVQELEKMGDFLINISQSRLEKKMV